MAKNSSVDYKTLFSTDTLKGKLANIFYNLLITGEDVTFESAAIAYLESTLPNTDETGKKSRILKKIKEVQTLPSNFEHTNLLKKVISEMVTLFEDYGFTINKRHPANNKKNVIYSYINEHQNPLEVFKYKAHLISTRTNLEKCIKDEMPVRINQKHHTRDMQQCILHPHLIKEYNGRSFVMGVMQFEDSGKTLRRRTLAIDRIMGDIEYIDNPYIQAEEGEYDFLKDIVGIRLEGSQKVKIRLRALDLKTFGRLVSKPIHHSQRTVMAFTDECGYGEVELEVIPNVELQVKIFSFGSSLIVISPSELREAYASEIQKMLDNYNQ